MNNHYLKKISTGLVLAGLFSGAVLHAENFIWENTSGDNDFNNGANWQGGLVPQAGRNSAVMDLAGENRAILSEGATEGITAIRIGYDTGDGEFEHSGGNVSATNNSNDASRVGRNGLTGTWNMTGGTANINSIQLGLGGGTGNLNVSGGELVIARGVKVSNISSSLVVGFGGTGHLEISGGVVRTRVGIQLGDGDADVDVFSVVGSNATEIGIGSQGSADGFWIQRANGMLQAVIDGGGVTPILVDEVGEDGGGDVTFEAGALLDVSFAGNLTAGTWTIMEWEGTLVDGGLAFADTVDTRIWSFNLDETNKVLTVTSSYENKAANWTNAAGDNDFGNADNWDYVTVNSASVNLSGADKAVVGTDVENPPLNLRVGVNATGELEIVDGGSLITTHNSPSRIGAGGSGNGSVVQTGGTFASQRVIEIGLDTGAVGSWVQTGGETSVNRGDGSSRSLRLGANGTGLYSIGGEGSVFQTRAGVELGTSGGGVGTFEVLGSGVASVGIGSVGSVDGFWKQLGGSTLKVGIDDGGVTAILIDEVGEDGGGDVTFESGAILDIELLGDEPEAETTWTVMEWEGTVTDNGLVLAETIDTNRWSFSVDADNKVLTVTYTPSDLPWANAEPGDVLVSSWFGSFEVYENGWLDHSELGWIYVGSVEVKEAMWIFSLYLDAWIYSADEYFPVAYDAGEMQWIYYFQIEGVGLYHFVYGTGEWTFIPFSI